MLLKVVITVLCGVGLYTALFMQAKARRAAAGGLSEPSVVQTPRARLLFGMTNASFGIIYYLAMGIGVWAAASPGKSPYFSLPRCRGWNV